MTRDAVIAYDNVIDALDELYDLVRFNEKPEKVLAIPEDVQDAADDLYDDIVEYALPDNVRYNQDPIVKSVMRLLSAIDDTREADKKPRRYTP